MIDTPTEILDGGIVWNEEPPVIDGPTGWEPTLLPQLTPATPEPIEYYPIDPYSPEPGETSLVAVQPAPPVFDPAPIDEVYPEIKTMVYPAPLEPTCNCIAAPCNCDGAPINLEPAPAVDGSTKYLGGAEPPPILTSTGTNNATEETMKIFGLPWYYVAGAGVGLLILLSAMDGD